MDAVDAAWHVLPVIDVRGLWIENLRGGGETREPGSEHISELTLRARYCHDTNAKLLGKLYHVLGDYEGRYSFYGGGLVSELCFT